MESKKERGRGRKHNVEYTNAGGARGGIAQFRKKERRFRGRAGEGSWSDFKMAERWVDG